MSKFYAQWRRPKRRERPWRVHPIWRGIGCFFIILIPVLSYGLADLLVQENLTQRWISIPRELTGPAAYPYLYAKLMLALVMAVVVYTVFTLVYTLVYSLTGPPRYGPLDAPPTRKRAAPPKRR